MTAPVLDRQHQSGLGRLERLLGQRVLVWLDERTAARVHATLVRLPQPVWLFSRRTCSSQRKAHDVWLRLAIVHIDGEKEPRPVCATRVEVMP